MGRRVTSLWRIITVVAIILFGCVGCTSCFPESEGGFWDYFTGNTLRHDKAEWEAELKASEAEWATEIRLATERARKEEAVLNGLREKLAIAQEHTEQLRLEKEIADAEARSLEAEAELKALEGQLLIDEAVAGSLTRSSRMHAILELVLIVFALFGVGVALGIIVTFVRERARGY